MKKHMLLYLLVVVIVFIAGYGFGEYEICGSQDKAVLDNTDLKVNILGIGDSIAEGHPFLHGPEHGGPHGDSDSQIWHHLVAALGGGYSYYNAGISFETISNVNARIDPLLESRSPDFVYLHVGINDILKNNSLPEYLSNLNSIFDKTRLAGAELIVGQIMPSTKALDRGHEEIKLWNAAIEKWCLENGIKLAPVYQEMTSFESGDKDDDINRSFDFDGIHPNIIGYSWLGKLYARAVVPTRKRVWASSKQYMMGYESWGWFYFENTRIISDDDLNPFAGSLALSDNSTADSPVKCLEEGMKRISISHIAKYGSVILYYRTSQHNFHRSDTDIPWIPYRKGFDTTDQFVQIRLGGSTVDAEISNLTLKWLPL